MLQAVEQRELDVGECHAQAAAQELVTQQARDEACVSLMAQRQQLEEAHDGDRALLLREVWRVCVCACVSVYVCVCVIVYIVLCVHPDVGCRDFRLCASLVAAA